MFERCVVQRDESDVKRAQVLDGGCSPPWAYVQGHSGQTHLPVAARDHADHNVVASGDLAQDGRERLEVAQAAGCTGPTYDERPTTASRSAEAVVGSQVDGHWHHR